MKRRLARIGGWAAELVGVGLIVFAGYRLAPELGLALAGVALLGIGYVLYGDWK